MYPHLRQFQTRDRDLERRLEHVRIAREREDHKPARNPRRLMARFLQRLLSA